MKGKVIARAWVLGFGYDCDGTYNKFVKAFMSIGEANKYADEATAFGDGEHYFATERWSEVVRYCERNQKESINYQLV